uniref:Uncharacterized protein LOC103325479 n=1 Tax=Rhizophora mucronata TaxID=61149 RepID=A0A2P2M027_RHIMU
MAFLVPCCCWHSWTKWREMLERV